MENRLVIIGGGPAGLTAAYELLKEKYTRVTVLEAADHLGGIATTASYQGNHMDMGGHRFFTKSSTVMQLWQELLPLQGKPARDELLLGAVSKKYAGQLDPEKTDAVFLQRRRVSRIYYRQHFFSYPITLSWETLKNLGLFTLWKVGWSYLYSLVWKRPERSLEDFYVNRFGKELYSMFFENYTEKIWGIHPAKISPEWGAQRVKGLSILGILGNIVRKAFGTNKQVETSLIEEFYYPKFGPGQMWEQLAQRIKAAGGQIELQQRVTRITKAQDGSWQVTAAGAAGQEYTYTCDQLFSSMPLRDLLRALPEVPQAVAEIAGNLPYRDFITVGLLVRKLRLKNDTIYKTVADIVPDCWIYIQEHGVKLGRLQIFNNWSPYLVKDLEHTVWLGLEYFCTEGDALWRMPKQEFIKLAIKELAQIGIIAPEDVLDATQVKVQKAYPAYFGGYKDFAQVKDYLKKLPRLYCIGRNGQHKYNNMDHSMLSALEAVKVMQGSSTQAALWEVNTEKEYQEELKEKNSARVNGDRIREE